MPQHSTRSCLPARHGVGRGIEVEALRDAQVQEPSGDLLAGSIILHQGATSRLQLRSRACQRKGSAVADKA